MLNPIWHCTIYWNVFVCIVPAISTIANNKVVKIKCIDWTGGQINNNNLADDIKNVDLTQIHYMSGPFHIETVEPGDVLLVEIQDVQPLQDHPWGFTGVFAGKSQIGLFMKYKRHIQKA